MDEDLPDPLANLDQAMADLAIRAKALRSYFQSLRAEGFSEAQAFTLVRDYQESLEP